MLDLAFIIFKWAAAGLVGVAFRSPLGSSRFLFVFAPYSLWTQLDLDALVVDNVTQRNAHIARVVHTCNGERPINNRMILSGLSVCVWPVATTSYSGFKLFTRSVFR